MANIGLQSLVIDNVNATTVKATVKYTVTPTQIEKLAGTVFSENVQLIGDDPGTLTDIVIASLPAQAFAVSTATPMVMRTRVINLLKSALNEDPDFLANGSEVTDEVLAKITLTYAANAPSPSTLPPPTSTNIVSGAWK